MRLHREQGLSHQSIRGGPRAVDEAPCGLFMPLGSKQGACGWIRQSKLPGCLEFQMSISLPWMVDRLLAGSGLGTGSLVASGAETGTGDGRTMPFSCPARGGKHKRLTARSWGASEVGSLKQTDRSP